MEEKRELVGKSGFLIKRVVMTSYAVSEGIRFGLTHEEKGRNSNMNNEILYLVEKTNPKVVSEFEFALKGVMLTIGCENCGIDKEQSGGVLLQNSQDSKYVQESTMESEKYIRIDRPNTSAVSSWGNSTIIENYHRWKGVCTKTREATEPQTRITNKRLQQIWKLQ